MPEPKRPLKVFLCHASADKPAVRDLYKRLTADGVDAWLDAENLIAGQNWQVEIPKAIRESDVVIVCLSEKSINREGYVQKEIKFALDIADEKPEGTIFIVPARLEECVVPNRLSDYHWVDLFEENGYEKLMRALRSRADKIDATLQIKKSWLPKFQNQKQATSIPESIQQTKSHKPKAEIKKPNLTVRELFSKFVLAFWGIFVLIAIVLSFLPSFRNLFSKDITTTNTPTLKSTATSLIPTNTVIAVTPISLPTEITDDFGVEMVLVPEGEFTMGVDGYSDNSPAHDLYLHNFYIDKYEVTNINYKECEIAGICLQPNKYNVTHSNIEYYDVAKYDNYPVVHVNWFMAKDYCEWRNARLPTEAEWKKAAGSFSFSGSADCNKANFYHCKGMPSEVGSYVHVTSPYGTYDMAGNVWEWVSSLYQPYPYTISDGREDLFSTGRRVLLGSGWYEDNFGPGSYIADSESRFDLSPNLSFGSVGFRCAKDANP